ncbi:MAG: RHS repeat-associated core domain-containing protein [Chryseobacterium jejuense]|uniref:RHS repeat-associated core domain-containing protein n=1 Tax=Chryseobacterium jejuense TaxID=445960 RepID=UPI003D0BCEBE
MKLFSSLILSLCSVLGFSQTILYQAETTSRTVQDPQSVVMAQGFHAKSETSNSFLAKIGPATENPGGGPTDSQAGANNPDGTSAPGFHDTKGEIDITASGQLQFTLPIALPPGVKSIAPQINLSYTSGSGNGIAGYGWNITGITAISRIGKTIEKDGNVKGVQLDYSDVYSFNGQRLILKTGEYGKDGAEYTTEKYSNIKIKSLGTYSLKGQDIGPVQFEVTFEDGSQAWYGSYNSGFNDRADATTPTEYNIVKWKDVHGNYISYNYESKSSTSGFRNVDSVVRISSIEWGGNEVLDKPHFNEISLRYTDRVFKELNYLQGVEFQQDKLLQNVVVMSNGNQFKRYEIEYDGNGTTYQFVKKITEYNAKDLPANPVTFNYEKNVISEQPPYTSFHTTTGIKKYADFNLDGETDYIELEPNGILKYKSSLYKGVPEINLTYDATKFSKYDFERGSVITFRKDKYIKNNIGIVIPIAKAIPELDVFNVELHIYSVDVTNQKLVFEYSKTLQHDQYYVGDQSNKDDDRYWYCDFDSFIASTTAYDSNGDGISEVILNIQRTLFCTKSDVEVPTEPLNTSSGASSKLNRPDDDMVVTHFYSTLLYDLNQQTPSAESYYKIEQRSVPKGYDHVLPKRMFADLNGDGVQDIIETQYPSEEITKVYNIFKSPQGSYSESLVGNFAGQSLTNMNELIFFGDFNGDNKADAFIPAKGHSNKWQLFISDGKNFTASTVLLAPFRPKPVVEFKDSHSGFIGNSCDRERIDYYNYDVSDIDGDGKSELIVTEVVYEEHEWQNHNDKEMTQTQVSVYSLNKIDNYSMHQGTDTSGKYTFYKTRVWDTFYHQKAIAFGQISMNNTHQQLILIGKEVNCSGCTENFVQFYDHPSLSSISRINAIEQGGSTINVVYKELNPDINPNFYLPIKKEEYPYYESSKLPKSFAVAQLNKTISQGQTLYQDFRYRGFLNHNTGKGFIGYRQTARSSWYTDGFENTKIWSGTEIDPLQEGLPVKEWSIRTNDESKIFPVDISKDNNQLLTFKATNYQAEKLLNNQVINGTISETDKPKTVTAIVPKSTYSKDFLTGSTTVSTTTYGDFYLPKQSSTIINEGYAITTSDFEYTHNLSGNGKDYFVGRPLSRTDIVKAYGDTKVSKRDYGYENNFLKTFKKWNRDNTGFILETYDYDGFGNIVKKVVNNSIDSQTQTEANEYDPKGRFVIKKTDNLGLETYINYNDWGQLVKETDPLGNIIENKYDHWGKLMKSKSNLEGITTYQYEKDTNLNIKIIQYDPDGDVSIKYTNKWGQNYKNSTKAFGQGKYVSKEIQYDALGRKIKESEPYFEGSSASQWNLTVYDDNVFPAKINATSFTGKEMETSLSGLTNTITEVNGNKRVTSNTKDALGNILHSTDKGGTIVFSYNAAGEQIKAQYAENIVTTKYDAWGRKSEFNDPSNGVYKYEFDGFGQPKKIISPKGTKEYTYNNLGQLISQKEVSTIDGGQSTNKIIAFTYDDKGRVIKKAGTSNGKSYSSNIVYDTQGRITSSSESSNEKYYIQKGITYDDKAKIISYEKQLFSSGILTKVQIENVYNAWNGDLYQIKDKNSGKILWELKDVDSKGQALKIQLGATDITQTYKPDGTLNLVNHNSPIKQKFLKILYNFNPIKNELETRTTEGDFKIAESFDYDDNNRLINWTNPLTGTKAQHAILNVYDDKGRIVENDQVGKIKFENPAKIYQPTGMILNATGTQNYTNDLIQNITYNENNDPVFIDGMKGDVAFQYGLTAMRQRVTYGGNFSNDGEGKFTKFYSENGSFEIVKDNITGKEKHILYIGGSPYESSVIYLKNYDEISGSYKFLHKDYLGSILAISDEAGNKLEQRHYDAWGNITHLQIGNGPILTDKNSIENTTLLIDRGYTSHEHFPEVGIIHMNGRLYDPLLRRFLNADEHIQDPYNTQNYNKYGYVLNNPLMFNDPSGEFFQFLGIGIALWKAIIIGAYIGFTSYIVTAAVTNQGVSLAGGLKAIFWGAASSAATFGIGSIFSTTAGVATQFAKSLGDMAVVAKAVVHGVAQGTLSLMQGDGFNNSFFSGALGSLGASGFGAIAGEFANSTIGTIAFGALAGGIGSELSGGNFWKGAVIGGIIAGFNDVAHRVKISAADNTPTDEKPKKGKVGKKQPTTKQVQPLVKQAAQVTTVIDVVGDLPGSGKLLKLVGKSSGKAFPAIETTSNLMEYSNGDISGQRLTYRSVGVGASVVIGAEIGSIVPGYGSAAGAVVGGIFGTAELLYDQFNQYVKPVMQQKVNNFSNQLKFVR